MATAWLRGRWARSSPGMALSRTPGGRSDPRWGPRPAEGRGAGHSRGPGKTRGPKAEAPPSRTAEGWNNSPSKGPSSAGPRGDGGTGARRGLAARGAARRPPGTPSQAQGPSRPGTPPPGGQADTAGWEEATGRGVTPAPGTSHLPRARGPPERWPGTGTPPRPPWCRGGGTGHPGVAVTPSPRAPPSSRTPCCARPRPFAPATPLATPICPPVPAFLPRSTPSLPPGPAPGVGPATPLQALRQREGPTQPAPPMSLRRRVFTVSMETERVHRGGGKAAARGGGRPETPRGVPTERPPCHGETPAAGTEMPPVMSAMEDLAQETPSPTAEPPAVPSAEDGKDPCGPGKPGTCPGEVTPVMVPVQPASLQTPAEQPGRLVPRGSCLIHSWQDESTGSSTARDTYRLPHRALLLGRGQRQAMLESMLYQKYRKEMLEEIAPRRMPMESVSTTHRDYLAGGFHSMLLPTTQLQAGDSRSPQLVAAPGNTQSSRVSHPRARCPPPPAVTASAHSPTTPAASGWSKPAACP
ncbi:uncharacterized protein LOC142358914 [Opisthocomus hoazin]|uniref:uncharacterized protein LOC142358914 n=1 Tax=Opisthocomus hoazin TaxID=30419 RepID=UPI003F532381